MNGEIKVGIFVLAGFVLFCTAIFLLGDYSFQKFYPVYVEFTDVAGLPDKALVKLSGVEVGKIKKISLKHDKVIVELAVREGVQIYRDSKFLVGSTSMIGSKFLEVDQGTPAAGVVPAGATVPGETTLALDRALAKAVDSIQGLVGDIRGQGMLARDLKEIMENMRQVSVNVNELVRNTQPHAEDFMVRMDSITVKLQDLVAKSDAIVERVDKGEGVAGALVSDPKMKQNVTDTLTNMRDASASVKDVLGRITSFRIFMKWDYRNEPGAKTGKNDFGMKIYPREGHYYYIGASNMGSDKNIPKAKDYETMNTIDAQFGWDVRAFNFYAGALHGVGGAGLNWKPFYDSKWDRLSVMLEASDFSRNRTIRGRFFNKPRYDAGVNVQLNKYVGAGVRVNELAEVKRVEYTTRVLFEDKDISYLFGLISVGSSGAKGRSSSK